MFSKLLLTIMDSMIVLFKFVGSKFSIQLSVFIYINNLLSVIVGYYSFRNVHKCEEKNIMSEKDMSQKYIYFLKHCA